MTLATTMRRPRTENFGGGIAGSVVLHISLAAALVGAALAGHWANPKWGENASQVGAIQASMVDALPLPTKAPPVEKAFLVQPEVTKAAEPPPKEAAKTEPKPTDVPVKAKPVAKTAPTPTEAPPKHAQPTETTPKAASAASATQLPQAIVQSKNGTASLTVQNHTFGQRYAYYLDAVQRIISQNWYTSEADPRTSMGKSVKLIFEINADGAPVNVRVETPSGSASLDASAVHALQRTDSFGPLPAGNSITIEDTFDYHP